MVWFKVDDAFDDHPKALAAGNAAIGLWTRCGAYSSRYLLEGFVPREVARAKGTKTEIARLLAAGLWHEVEGGYRMHDFLEYNPSEEQTKDRRAKTAKRVAEWRERHAQRDGAVSNADRNAVSNAAPDPTRPDPTPSYLHLLPTSSSLLPVAGVEEDQDQPAEPRRRTGTGIYTDVARKRA